MKYLSALEIIKIKGKKTLAIIKKILWISLTRVGVKL